MAWDGNEHSLRLWQARKACHLLIAIQTSWAAVHERRHPYLEDVKLIAAQEGLVM